MAAIAYGWGNKKNNNIAFIVQKKKITKNAFAKIKKERRITGYCEQTHMTKAANIQSESAISQQCCYNNHPSLRGTICCTSKHIKIEWYEQNV